jgi:hypothetical protein
LVRVHRTNLSSDGRTILSLVFGKRFAQDFVTWFEGIKWMYEGVGQFSMAVGLPSLCEIK